MNSERFLLQNSLEANYLNIRLDSGDKLDEIAVKVMQKDCPEFLIPFRMVSVNEETGLKYKLINTVALEYAEMTLPKVLFVQLYLNLLEPFVKGKDWFLDYHNLCVDAKYVYVDKHTYNVFYIYVPVQSFRNTDQEILDFFKNVFMNIMISDDKDFQVRLFRFFGGGQITLAGLYQLMLEEKGSSAPSQNAFSQSPYPQSGYPQGGGQQPSRQQPGSQQPSYSQPGYQQSLYPQSGHPQCGSPQPLFQQGNGPQPGFPQSGGLQSSVAPSVKPEEDKKKDGTDVRKKEKKQAPVKEAVSSPQVNMGYGENNGEDEVVQALFGNHKKSKKEKPSVESKKAEKDSGKKKQDEKGHGAFGGLFGGKKRQQANDSVQNQGMNYAPESKGNAAFAGGQQISSPNYASGTADYAALYGGNGFGAEETEVFSDDAAAAGTPWLELIDFSQPGALQRIDLNFTKPYIIIGRMSSDEKRPDVAFPGEFKRIGRQHARIERRGEDFFVIDLGSANHTMVNGQVMVPNQPYRLQDGMELAFTVSKPVRYRVHI